MPTTDTGAVHADQEEEEGPSWQEQEQEQKQERNYHYWRGGGKALTSPATKGKGLIAAFSSSILASLAPSAVARSLQPQRPSLTTTSTSTSAPDSDTDDDDDDEHAHGPSTSTTQQQQRQQQSPPLFTRHDEAPLVYTCPKCQREFNAWASCHTHVTGRCVLCVFFLSFRVYFKSVVLRMNGLVGWVGGWVVGWVG
jgi:hypothetical protein